MRAYLAVLKDSFREALASRVLWILLALTTLVLAAVAPIGLSERPATLLRQNVTLDPGLEAGVTIVSGTQLPQASGQQMVPVRFSSQQHAQLRQWCGEHGFSMATVIRGLVSRFLEGQLPGQGQPA